MVVDETNVYIINPPVYENGDTKRGLWIIDISNINNPTILSHYIGIVNSDYLGVFNSVNKSEHLIFLTQAPTANNFDILDIIDINNPSQPNSLGIFQGNYRVNDIAINDSIIYLATSDSGIRIINISNPENPVEISNILNAATGILYNDPYLYASTGIFHILNVNDPLNPLIVSSIQTHSSSSDTDISIEENFAYWAEWDLGLIDISDPQNPIQLKIFTGMDRGRGVAVRNDKIFFADQTQGVWILKNNLITDVKDETLIISDYELYQNYP